MRPRFSIIRGLKLSGSLVFRDRAIRRYVLIPDVPQARESFLSAWWTGPSGRSTPEINSTGVCWALRTTKPAALPSSMRLPALSSEPLHEL